MRFIFFLFLFFKTYNEYINVKCTVCFTPQENCTKNIIEKIDFAKNEILIQAYSFTSYPIYEALLRAKKRGVKIICIFDKSQENSAICLAMKEAKIDIWIDKMPGIAHNKIIIIDSETVFTGSFNFTKAAQFRNAENLLCIVDKQMTIKYKNNFQIRLNHSKKL